MRLRSKLVAARACVREVTARIEDPRVLARAQTSSFVFFLFDVVGA